MQKVRTGIIGCGKVAELHAQALNQLDCSDFVAVCDVQRSRAQKMADRFQTQAFDSIGEMIRTSGVEAVVICTPHPLHEEPAVIAAKNNQQKEKKMSSEKFHSVSNNKKRNSPAVAHLFLDIARTLFLFPALLPSSSLLLMLLLLPLWQ